MRQLFPSPVDPADQFCPSLSPRLVGGDAKRILDGLPVPGPAPCACARSASRTGSCSCATVRGQVARLPAWTH
jgi:hypothetical protein